LTKKIDQYNWSSYKEYVKRAQIIDVDLLLEMFNDNREEAIQRFIEYNNEVNDYICLDMEEKHQIVDEEARNIIKEVCKVQITGDLQKLEIGTRNRYLNELKEQHGLSIRQIERLTGINRGIILKA
jgi:Mg/Co/Ni transporter MgtE